MLGLGKRTFNTSMTTICLCLFILLINQLLLVRSFRLSTSDIDLSEPEDLRRAAIQRLVFENSDDFIDDNDLQVPKLERRFCCMSPLSGRKRSVRDLTRKQITNRQSS